MAGAVYNACMIGHETGGGWHCTDIFGDKDTVFTGRDLQNPVIWLTTQIIAGNDGDGVNPLVSQLFSQPGRIMLIQKDSNRLTLHWRP